MKLLFKHTVGLFGISIDGCKNDYCIHFFVKKKYRQWGYYQDWYDGPIHSFGVGFLLLICWMESEQ